MLISSVSLYSCGSTHKIFTNHTIGCHCRDMIRLCFCRTCLCKVYTCVCFAGCVFYNSNMTRCSRITFLEHHNWNIILLVNSTLFFLCVWEWGAQVCKGVLTKLLLRSFLWNRTYDVLLAPLYWIRRVSCFCFFLKVCKFSDSYERKRLPLNLKKLEK